MGLIRVQDDRVRRAVIRDGRFTVTQGEADCPLHLEAAAEKMARMMIAGLAKRGYEWANTRFYCSEPEPHIRFSEDMSPDPADLKKPALGDALGWARYERAERDRVSRKAGEDVGLVDFVLKSVFIHEDLPTFHTVGPGRFHDLTGRRN